MSGTDASEAGIGARIRQERERLKLSAGEFALIGGVSDRSQRNYESGDRFPDAEYLYNAGRMGADCDFILFGERSSARRLAMSVKDECLLLGKVLADLDATIEKVGLPLDPSQKAKCIVHLYHLGRFGGPSDDHKVLEEVVMLASGSQRA